MAFLSWTGELFIIVHTDIIILYCLWDNSHVSTAGVHPLHATWNTYFTFNWKSHSVHLLHCTIAVFFKLENQGGKKVWQLLNVIQIINQKLLFCKLCCKGAKNQHVFQRVGCDARSHLFISKKYIYFRLELGFHWETVVSWLKQFGGPGF